MNNSPKLRYSIFIVICITLLSACMFIFNIINNDFYNLVDNNGKCVISGYEIELVSRKINQQTVYYCTPILLVNFTYNGKLFNYVNTYSFEYPNNEYDMFYYTFDDDIKKNCIDKLKTNEKYEIGTNIGFCYKSYYSDDNKSICRKQHTVNKKIHNSNCNHHFNSGDGYIQPIIFIVCPIFFSCAFIFLAYMELIKQHRIEILKKIINKNTTPILPVTIQNNQNGSYELLYKVTTDKIETIDDEMLLESGEKKMK